MKNNKFNVVLASASPRRKELLGRIFENFEICISNAEETLAENLEIEKQPEYLARLKGEEVAKKFPESLVISADTSVLTDSEILGKPKDKTDAVRMLKSLSGNTHMVITGCALFFKGKSRSFSTVTEVEFYQLSDKEIEEYVALPEPYDKAGAYGIQSAGGLFVKGIKGDYFNVVGLPVAELKRQINLFLNEI